jgi:hypothetical protein
MSYALGALEQPQTTIRLGEAAKTDPLLSLATLYASAILLEVSVLPPNRRLDELRAKMNALYADMGNKAVSKTFELQRRGEPPDQAAFDGVRLAIANRLAEFTLEQMKAAKAQAQMSGLGDTASDLAAAVQGFCAFGIGTAATATGMVAAFTNPTASTGVVNAANAGATIAGCSNSALATQAQTAAANAAAAQANAAAAGMMSQAQMQQQQLSSNKMITYVAVGGGVLAVLGIGFLALRKK